MSKTKAVRRRAISETDNVTRDPPNRPFFSPPIRWLLVALLLATAFGVRIHRISDPPFDYSAPRQFRSALIARSYYYDTIKSLPEWKTRNARLAREAQGVLEPPVMEMITAAAYRIAGGAELWIPRALSIFFWLAGGVMVGFLAVRIADPDSALISMAVFLCLPFSVIASRLFQPDPLMVMMFVASILTLVRYLEETTTKRLAICAACAAAAVFVKPVCAFPLAGSILFAIPLHIGIGKTLRSRHFWLLSIAGLLPAAAFYAYGTFVTGDIRQQAGISFMPKLLLESTFWIGWLRSVETVVGYPALAGGLLGLALMRPGQVRLMLAGLWAGYFVYGLMFTYHIHTHDYYQLPLIPIVALSLAPAGTALIRGVERASQGRLARAAVGLVFVMLVLLSIDRSPVKAPAAYLTRFIEVCEEVGDAIEHSDRNILLGPAYSKPLMYYGEIPGTPWPPTVELRAQRLRGRPDLTAAQRLARFIERKSPKYFIATNLPELRRQADLMRLLTTNYVLVENAEDYVIFDLEQPRDGSAAP